MNTTQNETAILSTKDIDIMRKDDVRNEMAILSAMDTVRRLEERIDRLEKRNDHLEKFINSTSLTPLENMIHDKLSKTIQEKGE